MPDMTKPSPVLVLTCNRVEHFRRLVASLGNCSHAAGTEVYVAIDGPCDSSAKQAHDSIVELSRRICGFSQVHVILREANLGVSANFMLAVEEIFRTHDTLILLEDDNVVAENFLSYMNAVLRQFKDNPKCFSICGYNCPVAAYPGCSTDVYQSPLVNAWGVGFFRDRYFRTDLAVKQPLDRFFLNPLNVLRMHRLSPPLFPLYVHAYMTGQEFGDVLYAKHSLEHGLFSVHPVNTKVMNLGFDGSGAHCTPSDAYAHSAFLEEGRHTFVLDLDGKTSNHYVRVCGRHYAVAFRHRWRHTFYSYFLYGLCLLIGREQTVRLRDFVKTQVWRLLKLKSR